jgi:hypothetical protein
MLTLSYGCGLRAGEVVRLRAGDIDSEQTIRTTFRYEWKKPRAVRNRRSCGCRRRQPSGNFDGSNPRCLQHDLEGWKPDFRKNHRSTEILERESLQSGAIAL